MSRSMGLLLGVLGLGGALALADGPFPAKTLILGADAPEKRFFDVGKIGPACVGQTDWKKDGQLISLADTGDAVEFYLPTVRGGMYVIAVRCRTGHQLTGWEYCMPKVSYAVEVDGQAIAMERGNADPILVSKGQGWTDYAGWIVSRDYVSLRPGSRVKITAGENYAYVTKVAFLTPTQGMACEWLVPDVVERSYEQVTSLRAKLLDLEERSRRTQLALAGTTAGKAGEAPVKALSLAATIQAVDNGLADHRARLATWRRELRQAQERNDHALLAALQRRRETLLAEVNQPLRWAQGEAETWCQDILTLTAIPDSGLPVPPAANYHGRWAEILKGWIATYRSSLATPPKTVTDSGVARRLARAMRLLDLTARYRTEAALAAATAPPAPPPTLQATAATVPVSRQPASVCLNGRWEFQPGTDPNTPPTTWETIRVPHGPWQETYGSFFNAGKKWDPTHHVGWYRTRFFVPANWNAQTVAIRFDAVFYYAEVYVNGVYCGHHLGGFDRFSVPLAQAVRPGMMNEMLVMVKDSHDTATDLSATPSHDVAVPNYLAVNDLWNVNFGGIWQDVFLEYRPNPCRIAEVAVSTPVRGGVRLKVTGSAVNDDATAKTLRCRFTLLDDGRPVTTLETAPQRVAARAAAEWRGDKAMPGVKLWGIGGAYGAPHLYRLKTELLADGLPLDVRYDPVGFSQLWIDGDKFFLNGKELFLAGGGIWYLQENKFPLANRFFASQLFRMDRGANIAIERLHRHGDITESYFQEASEMGMLLEQEANPGPGPAGVTDVMGRPDLDDPVWRANLRSYYQTWAAKHRNYPCIGLTSVDNENFSYSTDEEAMRLFLEMGRTVQQEDPLRLYDLHGNHQLAGYPGVLFINLHYFTGPSISQWKKVAAGRPIINGEHNSGGTMLVNNQDRAVAAKAEDGLAGFWRDTIRWYRQDAAGLFVFMPALQAYCTTSDWKKTTPWGEQFQDLSRFSSGDDRWPCDFVATIPVSWPSESGPDAKAETARVAATDCTFNWFDPSRPVCTPNKVYDALKESFPPLAPANAQRCQEALVTVTAAGKPVSAATVILEPLDGQPVGRLGAVTDPAGTAWIVPRLPGRYRVVVEVPGGRQEATVVLRRYAANQAGYEHGLVRVTVEAIPNKQSN